MTGFLEYHMSSKWLVGALSIALFAAACGSDEKSGFVIPCTDDELYDQVNDTCVARESETTPDMGQPDAADNNSTADVGMTGNNGIPDGCDIDQDGALSAECGGDDCDDLNRQRSPAYPEICDEVDNNCNEELNDGINCEFFGHSGSTLYRVDPFKKVATQVGADLPNLQDIDTHPDGTLYGVTFDGLYRLPENARDWQLVGDFGTEVADPNGLAIDSRGDVFVTGQDKLYEIDTASGAATLVGTITGDGETSPEYYSSGDCVINKRDTLYMTSKHIETEDTLLTVQADNAVASELGPMGFDRVFGLTAAWGNLYGLTFTGDLIEINSVDGAARLVHTFEDISWFGAASTPERD
jgi:sugar lactone lactonase YvrE